MADSDGVIKLVDAIQVLDLQGMIGYEKEPGEISLMVGLTDGENVTTQASGYLDATTGIAWVQLPIDVCDVIICQAGEQAKRAELDRWSSSTHAHPQPDPTAEGEGLPSGERPSPCEWHAGWYTQKGKPKRGSFAYCYACERFMPRGGKNRGKDFDSEPLDADLGIVSVTLVDTEESTR